MWDLDSCSRKICWWGHIQFVFKKHRTKSALLKDLASVAGSHQNNGVCFPSMVPTQFGKFTVAKNQQQYLPIGRLKGRVLSTKLYILWKKLCLTKVCS